MTTLAQPKVRDELDAIMSALCDRFPDRSRSEIETIVLDVYSDLAAKATVVAHLIPLTLNRSRQRLIGTATAGESQ